MAAYVPVRQHSQFFRPAMAQPSGGPRSQKGWAWRAKGQGWGSWSKQPEGSRSWSGQVLQDRRDGGQRDRFAAEQQLSCREGDGWCSSKGGGRRRGRGRTSWLALRLHGCVFDPSSRFGLLQMATRSGAEAPGRSSNRRQQMSGLGLSLTSSLAWKQGIRTSQQWSEFHEYRFSPLHVPSAWQISLYQLSSGKLPQLSMGLVQQRKDVLGSLSHYLTMWVCLKIGYIPNYSHLII